LKVGASWSRQLKNGESMAQEMNPSPDPTSRHAASDAAKQAAERAGYTAIEVQYITSPFAGQWVVMMAATARSGKKAGLTLSVTQSASGWLAHIEHETSE
jgi:hypothetical protein